MILVFLLFIVIIILFIASWLLFSQYRTKGAIARALNMGLFLIRVPREFPKEGQQQQKQEKELISITEQLLSSFTNIHSKGWNRILYGEPYISFELAVHHIGEEIHFYIAVPKSHEEIIEKQIHGFYPTAEVLKTKDYNIFNPRGATLGSYFILGDSHLLPFKTYQKLETDPLGEILTAMSKLEEEGEGTALQVLIRPSHKTKLKSSALKIAKEIQKGHSFKEALSIINRNEFIEGIKEVFKTQNKQEQKQKEEMKVTTPYHEELVKSIVNKASKQTFDTNIRIIASANSEARANQILHDLEGSFVQFSSPDLNSLKPIRVRGRSLEKLIFNFSFRIFDDKKSIYLSTEELASIYHFPLPTTLAPRVKLLKAKPAEPPPDLPKEGIIIGKNIYRGQEKLIRMQSDDRRRHLYIIGQTGTGKSTFLNSLIQQDIKAGEGVCVIDPHGDLVEDILGVIPKERFEDVILFDPGDTSRVLGLNILEIDPERPEQKSFVIDDFYKILRQIYKDVPEAFGPIFEKFFKNSLMLLLDDYKNEIPTIADISRVFADKDYRDAKLSREVNPEVVRFWQFEAEKMSGDWSLPNMSGYITSKFAPFILNEYVRPIITQQKSAFNFRDVMDNQKILLVKLSKGKIGDLNANLLGMIVVSKLLISALSRVDISQEMRRDFYLYMDEFQNFTTDSIATILSEARKYRLNLIIAHQFIKQLQENIRDAVFGNVGSIVSFRVGPDDSNFFKEREIFEPVFSAQDLLNVDNFNAYVKLLINNQPSRPFNIQIIRPLNGDHNIANAVRELSMLKYGRPREEVEKEFIEKQRG